jgi:hypothetical protein
MLPAKWPDESSEFLLSFPHQATSNTVNSPWRHFSVGPSSANAKILWSINGWRRENKTFLGRWRNPYPQLRGTKCKNRRTWLRPVDSVGFIGLAQRGSLSGPGSLVKIHLTSPLFLDTRAKFYCSAAVVVTSSRPVTKLSDRGALV